MLLRSRGPKFSSAKPSQIRLQCIFFIFDGLRVQNRSIRITSAGQLHLHSCQHLATASGSQQQQRGHLRRWPKWPCRGQPLLDAAKTAAEPQKRPHPVCQADEVADSNFSYLTWSNGSAQAMLQTLTPSRGVRMTVKMWNSVEMLCRTANSKADVTLCTVAKRTTQHTSQWPLEPASTICVFVQCRHEHLHCF